MQTLFWIEINAWNVFRRHSRTLCQTICETLYSFINWTCRKLSHIFCSVTFNLETLLDFGWRFQNSFVRHFPDTISSLNFHSNLELLGGHCSFSSICGQFFWRHCWQTRAMSAEPHSSCWFCRSVWQQSVALFNELWEQKLLNNFNFHYCLQQH